MATDTVINLQPVWDAINPIIQAVVAAAFVSAVTWLRNYFKLSGDVAANAAIADGASRLAAMMIQRSIAMGVEPTKLSFTHPIVVGYAQQLTENFPGYFQRLGVTPEKAAAFVMAEANKLLIAGPSPTGMLTPPQPKP